MCSATAPWLRLPLRKHNRPRPPSRSLARRRSRSRLTPCSTSTRLCWKPEGKSKLDDLVSKLKGITLEVVIAVGHTDSFGSDKYNDRLSVRRAEAVKGYLVSKGIEANRVYTEGKGKRQLKVDPKSCKGARKAQIACQQPNRRVEVEVVGTRSAQ